MTWQNKVTWSEGLFLRPQLFQQQERYLEYYAHKRCLPLSSFFWGFSHLRIDPESLGLGKIVLASVSGIFPDGTPFDVPGQTPPPPPLTLQHEHLGQTIYLALSIRAPNSEETTFDAQATGSTARYVAYETELRDANSNGYGSKPVQLAQLRLRLIPKKELTDSWMGLPVAKVAALRSDGAVELEPQFIAPVNVYGASEKLSEWISQIHGVTLLRAQNLAARLAGSTGDTQTAEVTDVLQLQTLNRYEPLLRHYQRVKDSSPELLYSLLLSLNGEMATFAKDQSRRPNEHPAYEHLDPYVSFKALVDDTRAMLHGLQDRNAQIIPLEIRPHGLRLGSLAPDELTYFSHLVLAVAAQMPADVLAQQFPAQSKVAPASALAEHVRLHLPGIPMSVLPVPPRQIPFNAGYVYFQVESQGTLWELMRKTGGIGLHIGTDFPGLRLELWGIR
ncbi:type VI secretion system baseplate subunit TssK [Comamonas composti]|uniref:type VI secretion system baseplate subunit TssK n=1 Tax=Comamonas composti TaxID=408558 RepID=UPI00047AC797|nr:type VI secretion system baseplate subunit TssK [Comamonas composti]